MRKSPALKNYYKNKDAALAYLGGVCVVCGTTDDLEFDHIDPETKSFTIGSRIAQTPWSNLKDELDKCQLLCNTHHIDKHRSINIHGTINGYSHHKCRCDLCKTAWNAHHNEYRYRVGLRKRPSIPGKLVGLAA